MIPIQLLAMLTMLIDHIGVVWFPEDPVWRVIGRLALPIYAYSLVIGYFRTSNCNRYLRRLGILALLSQIPYSLVFETWEANAIATLFVCLLNLHLLDRFKDKVLLQGLIVAASIALLELIPFDYGAYALLLTLIYRYAKPSFMVLLHMALNIAALFAKGWLIQMASLFTTVIIVYLPDLLRALDKIRVPRLLWRSFYPGHLAILAVLYHFTA